MKTAILVDGGFYRRKAQQMLGDLTATERARELGLYCRRHLNFAHNEPADDLYRIFYYDCLPTDKKLFHPLLKKQIDYSKTDLFVWMNAFIGELKQKRKFALRLGSLAQKHEKTCYTLTPEAVKDLCNNKRQFSDLTEKDFALAIEQKGVDIKIGVDIASLAYKNRLNGLFSFLAIVTLCPLPNSPVEKELILFWTRYSTTFRRIWRNMLTG